MARETESASQSSPPVGEGDRVDRVREHLRELDTEQVVIGLLVVVLTAITLTLALVR